ncbi:MAG: BACON domain-containing protein, partial [Bryobacterales bacterium]|nr:BACON domain-containing protein [Bryobacterales bacterium]
ASNPGEVEDIRFRVVVEFPANTVTAGTSQVRLTLHPDTTATTRIPRFTTAAAPQTAFVVNPVCTAITCTPATLNFSSIAQATPPPQAVNVVTPGEVSFSTTSNVPWLTVNPASGQILGARVLSVSANPALAGVGLAAGNIVVSTGRAECVVNANLNVTGVQIAPSPDVVTFDYFADGTVLPAQANIVVNSSGGQTPVEASVGPDSQWIGLSPTNFVAPGTFSIRPNVQGLAPRNVEGIVFLRSPGAPAVTVQVRLRFQQRQLTFNPNPLNLTWQAGSSTIPSGTIAVTSVPSPVAIQGVTAATDDGRNWLIATGSGQTPTNLTATIDPTRVNPVPGQYGGTITVQTGGNQTFTTRVILTVTSGPTLSVNPSTLSFTHTVGAANPASQTVSVSSSSPLGFTVASNQPWLSTSLTSGTTPASLGVAVNPTGLAAGIYDGVLTFTAGTQTATVAVRLTVVSQNLLEVAPGNLTFNYVIGGALPASQLLTIRSPQPRPFNLTPATQQGGNWLSLSQLSGQTDAAVGVSVNPANLGPGTYTGSITITSQELTQIVPVTLNVTQSLIFSATPSPITFFHAFGNATPPAAQQLTITSASPLTYSATASSVGNWLVISQNSGNTVSIGGTPTSSLVVSANPLGLAPSATPYTGTITLTTSTAPAIVVNVSLTVSGSSLTVSPSSLSFTHQINTNAPQPQVLFINSPTSGQPITLTATSGGWLQVTPTSAQTPASIAVSVLPSGLEVGIYNGSIQIVAGSQTQTVPVTLNVIQSSITVSPTTLRFEFSPGGTVPPAQTVSVSSVPGGQSFGVSATSTGGWLSVSSSGSITPATLTVSVAPQNLQQGTYTGQITVTSGGFTEIVTVTLVVQPFTLTVSPTALTFDAQPGGPAPSTQTVNVTSVPPGVNFSIATSAEARWLSASASSGRTPATLTVSVDPTGLDAGTYTGTITVTAQGQSQSVAVTLNVARPVLNVNPSSLTFNHILLQDPPASQTVSVTSVPTGINFGASVASNSAWLSASVASSRTPGSVTVSVDPTGLNPGTYTGTIAVTAAGQTQNVGVTFTITGGTLNVSPSQADFNATAGAQTTEPIRVQVNSNPPNLPFSFSGAAPWLSAESSSGTTPATLTLRANPAGLAPGTYTSTITITAPGATNSPQSVRVSLVVTGPPTITTLSQTSAVAGSQGFALTVNGTNFVQASQILVNGSPLATTFVSGTQLRADIPANLIARPGSIEIRVASPGGLTSPQVLFVVRLAANALRLEIAGNTGPGEQPRVVAVLNEAASAPLAGTLTMTFSGRDTAVQFASGGRTATFAIAAGATRSQEVPFSTGTVAGRIDLVGRVTSGGADLTPDPVPSAAVTIDPAAPVIRRVELQRSNDGFAFVITGFTSTRELTEINVRFNGNVQPAEVTTNVAAIFTTYFNNTANDQFGGQFELRFPFTGQTTGITSAVVTLVNSRGRSNSVTVNF